MNTFLENFKRKELLELDSNSVELILETSKNIFSNKIIPNWNLQDPLVGLIVGEVQSGKTKNFISLLSYAFDNGFELGIIFAGIDKTLLEQNKTRIEKSFSNIEDLSIINSNDLLHNNVDFTKLKKYVILVALKEDQHLKKINECEALLKINKTIIIDDEGDVFSLNKEDRHLDNKVIDNYSVINKEIVLLLYKTKALFITITATPYSNLFLNEKRELYPSFLSFLPTGKNYKGLIFYHGNESLNNKIVSKVDDNIQELYDRIIHEYIYVNTYLRFLKKTSKYYEMIVNTSEKNVDHQLISNALKKEIEDSISVFENQIKNNNFAFSQLKGIIRKNLQNYISQVEILNLVESFEDIDYIKSFFDALYESYKNTKIEIWNQNSEKYDIDNIDKVIIGSKLIQRGVTFIKLRTVYMTKETKIERLDALIQRARWLGYHDVEKNLFKIYMPLSLKEKYEGATIINTYFNKILKEIDRRNFNLKENKIYFNWENSDFFVGRPEVNINKDKENFLSFIPIEKEFNTNVDLTKKILNILISEQKYEIHKINNDAHIYINLDDLKKLFQSVINQFLLKISKNLYDFNKFLNYLRQTNQNQLKVIIKNWFNNSESLSIESWVPKKIKLNTKNQFYLDIDDLDLFEEKEVKIVFDKINFISGESEEVKLIFYILNNKNFGTFDI